MGLYMRNNKRRGHYNRRKRHSKKYYFKKFIRNTLVTFMVMLTFFVGVSLVLILASKIKDKENNGIEIYTADTDYDKALDDVDIITDYRMSGKEYVVLDAGHGGKDTGAIVDDIYEKDINLPVTLYLRDILVENGVSVILTRSTDTFIELEERAQIANDAEATMFVSIHCNYYEDDSDISGLECYYYPDDVDSLCFATDILDIVNSNGVTIGRKTVAEDLSVLRNTNMRAVLIELGYMSNSTNLKQLQDEDFQIELAYEIAEGIINNLTENDD